MGAIAEAMAAFAQPLIDQTDGSAEQMHKAFAISQLCWNIALLPEEEWDQCIDELQATFHMDDDEFDEFRNSMVLPMIRRHREMFPFYRQRLSAPRSRVGITMHDHSRIETPADRDTEADPYGPCPCNSGKKYKFCCRGKAR